MIRDEDDEEMGVETETLIEPQDEGEEKQDLIIEEPEILKRMFAQADISTSSSSSSSSSGSISASDSPFTTVVKAANDISDGLSANLVGNTSHSSSPNSSSTSGNDTVVPSIAASGSQASSIISSLLAGTSSFAGYSYSSYTPPTTTTSPTITSSSGGNYAAAGAAQATTTSSVNPISQAVAAAQSYAIQQEMGAYMPTVTLELIMVPTQVS